MKELKIEEEQMSNMDVVGSDADIIILYVLFILGAEKLI